MAPKTHITKHHGPTNKKLRCHLPLVVPSPVSPGGQPCRLRVGDNVQVVKEGECFIFDDSLEHEAWNDAEGENGTRIVLIIDLWHPDLSNKEVKFLDFCLKSQMRMEKRNCARIERAALEQAKTKAAKAAAGAEGNGGSSKGGDGDGDGDGAGAGAGNGVGDGDKDGEGDGDRDADEADLAGFESFYSIIEESKQFAPSDDTVFGQHGV